MTKFGKILCLFAVLLILTAGQVFSQDLAELQSALTGFSGKMAESLPLNSTMGLNWSDAYIGQFLGIPPHFGVGITSGFTFVNVGSINELLDMFGGSSLKGVNANVGMPIPGYTVEGRIGGFILPFDAGVKVGYIPPLEWPFFNFDLDYLLVGADFRYSLLPKSIPLLKMSAGLGVNRLTGGISKTIPSGIPSFSFSDGSADYTLSVEDPSIGLFWNTTSYELKAQASFSLIILTPYAGVGLSYAKSEVGYQVKTRVSVTDDTDADVDLSVVKDTLGQYGMKNITEDGFKKITENDGFNVRFYGGTSLNLTVFKFDLTAMYDVTSSNLGLTLGVRFQL